MRGRGRAARLTATAAAVLLVLSHGLHAGASGRSRLVGAQNSESVESLVLEASLPGMVEAPPGPANGPVDPATFASYAPDPQAVERSFETLEGEPGFSSWERLWHSPSGRSDVLDVLIRFPSDYDAASFVSRFESTLATGGDARRTPVPGVPGAFGFTITLAGLGGSGAAGRVQVVAFRYEDMADEIAVGTSLMPPASHPVPGQAAAELALRQYRVIELSERQAAPERHGGLDASKLGILASAILLVALGVGAAALRMRAQRRSSASEVAQRVPGWYQDPSDPSGRKLRYHDGTAWTGHVAEPVEGGYG
jgi:hypothetical protein